MKPQIRRAAVGMKFLCAAQIAALTRAIPIEGLRLASTGLMFGLALCGFCLAAPSQSGYRRAGWALGGWTLLTLLPVGTILLLKQMPQGQGAWLSWLYLASEPLGELAWCIVQVSTISAAAALAANGGWVHVSGRFQRLFFGWTAAVSALGLVSVSCGTLGGPMVSRLSVWLLSVILAGEVVALLLNVAAAVLLWRGGKWLADAGRD